MLTLTTDEGGTSSNLWQNNDEYHCDISEMLRILLCNNYSPFTMDFWDYFKNEKNNKNP